MDISVPQNVTFERYLAVTESDGVTPFDLSTYELKGDLAQGGIIKAAFTLTDMGPLFTVTDLPGRIVDWILDTETLATLKVGVKYDFDIIAIGPERTYPLVRKSTFTLTTGVTPAA